MVASIVKLCLSSLVLASGEIVQGDRPHRLVRGQQQMHRPHMLNQRKHHAPQEEAAAQQEVAAPPPREFVQPMSGELYDARIGRLHLKAQTSAELEQRAESQMAERTLKEEESERKQRKHAEAQQKAHGDEATVEVDEDSEETVGVHEDSGEATAKKAPAPAAGAPADFAWAEKMDASRGLPSQGFEGDKVKHVDMDTMAADWHKERKPAASLCGICERHIANPWCHRKCPHVREMWLKTLDGKNVKVNGWYDGKKDGKQGKHAEHGQDGATPPGMVPKDGHADGAGDVLKGGAAERSLLAVAVSVLSLFFA